MRRLTKRQRASLLAQLASVVRRPPTLPKAPWEERREAADELAGPCPSWRADWAGDDD